MLEGEESPAAVAMRSLANWDGLARPHAGDFFYDRARSALR